MSHFNQLAEEIVQIVSTSKVSKYMTERTIKRKLITFANAVLNDKEVQEELELWNIVQEG